MSGSDGLVGGDAVELVHRGDHLGGERVDNRLRQLARLVGREPVIES